MRSATYLLHLLAALGCGVIGGVFFAFSTFVMKALTRLPADQGIAAMQHINVVVLNAWFLGVFLGTAVLCGVAALMALLRWQTPGAGWLVIGAVSYLVGTLLVTMVCNVPRNDALAAVAPTAPGAAGIWTEYVASWTFWNHVRTAAALIACAAFILALTS